MSRRNSSTREKYDRMARGYDLMEFFPETFFFGRFRKMLFATIRGRTLLEVGVGTGKNIEYYPRDMQVTAVDFSAEMLKRARRRAEKLQVPVTLVGVLLNPGVSSARGLRGKTGAGRLSFSGGGICRKK